MQDLKFTIYQNLEDNEEIYQIFLFTTSKKSSHQTLLFIIFLYLSNDIS